jgi:LrgB-like family
VVPRSVTAALALPIAASLDAPLPVTAAAVVCTGGHSAASHQHFWWGTALCRLHSFHPARRFLLSNCQLRAAAMLG